MKKLLSAIFVVVLTSVIGCGGAGAGNTTGLSITTNTFPTGNRDHQYSATLEATGGKGPYVWSIEPNKGVLPDGLSLNGTTGEISGVPTVANSFAFTVNVLDSAHASKSKALAIKIGVAMSARAEITMVTSDWPTGAEYDLVVSIWAEFSNTTSSQTVHLTASSTPVNLSLVATKLVDQNESVIIKAEVVPPASINGGIPTSTLLFVSQTFELRALHEGNATIDVWPGRPSPYLTIVHYKLSAADVH